MGTQETLPDGTVRWHDGAGRLHRAGDKPATSRRSNTPMAGSNTACTAGSIAMATNPR